MEHLAGRGWRTSSYSATSYRQGGTDCVEVGLDPGAEGVLVRDTKPVRALSCGSARGLAHLRRSAEGGPSPPGLIARIGVSGAVDVDETADGRGYGG